MSTRRLITVALICGLAILLAGGVMLVRLVRDRDRLTVSVLAAETPATVGGIRVRITSHERRAGAVRIVVSLDTPAAHGLDDAGTGFALTIGDLRHPVAPADAGVSPCRGMAVAAGRSVSCALAFADRSGSATLAYAYGGQQAQWSLGR